MSIRRDERSKAPSADILSAQFRDPSSDYGPIDCWWWEAGHLDRERMRGQLEEMKEKGISGTWFYPRFVYGQPLGSDPLYWTEEWWDLTRFSAEEHQRLGMQMWFNDWTAHQFFQNKLREECERNPALSGRRLVMHEAESRGPGAIEIDVPDGEEVLHAAAYRRTNDGLDFASAEPLNDAVAQGTLRWNAEEAGWVAIVITSEPYDLDYLNRAVADRWIEILLKVYEEKLSDFVGSTLRAYGTDELFLLNGNTLYSPSLLDRFEAEKGYDPSPYLVGLFHDIGNSTDKIRCEYYDVMTAMLEENLYGPFGRWLDERGMLFVDFCPNGKTGDLQTQAYHYGDFLRYLRSYSIPGSEEQSHRPPECTFFAKTSSSIAHLYGRARVGVCAYWGSGWGHTTAENLAWTNENYAYGVNLYNRHGALYTTLGGWYEWVPPAVHFRQPYWQYWRHFTDYVRRLSYVLSQGVHVADVALLYPMTTLHAGWSGGHNFTDAAGEAGAAMNDLAGLIYRSGIDFDFIDDASLLRAEVKEGALTVSDLAFRALVMPPMTTIQTDTLEKIKAFYEGGGTVVAFGRLPQASAENGREDPNVRRLLSEIFGTREEDEAAVITERKNERGGRAIFLREDTHRVPEILANTIDQDIRVSGAEVFHTHQRVGEVDVYFLFNAREEKRRISASLRASGQPEVWNAFTGEVEPVLRFEMQGDRTQVRLDIEPYEGVLLVLRPSEEERPEVVEDNLAIIASVEPGEGGIDVQGFCETGGEKRIRVTYRGTEYRTERICDDPPQPIRLEDLWDFELEPTMDNRWGDFRYPPSEEHIGPEARRFHYMEEGARAGTEQGWHERDFDASGWEEVTYSYGPYWWTTGPFEEGNEPTDLLERAKAGEMEVDQGGALRWQRYSFSQKHGYDDPAVHSDWGGLLGVSENFLVFDAVENVPNTVRYLFAHVYSPEEADRLLDFGGEASFPRQAWVNGELVISVSDAGTEAGGQVRLLRGWNAVLLKLVQPGGERIETFAVFQDPQSTPSFDPYVPLLRWFVEPQDLVFDITPEKEHRVGWYRFTAPPGLRSMKLSACTRDVSAWVDGRSVEVANGKVHLETPMEGVSQVALRVEQEPGAYAGAAFPLPVTFECEEGRIPLGNWCEYGLETYSGGAVYTTEVVLEKRHLEGKVLLDLGEVSATAEVHINGEQAGVRMGPPFCFDVTDLVVEGENRIRVKVVNSLANHMSTYPTNFVYEGQTVSGLLGPVTIRFFSTIALTAVSASGSRSR